MAPNASGIDLVFTVALAPEIPIRWLREQGARVCELKELESRGLPPAGGRNAGVLFVITGMGPGPACRAATWVRDHLAPRFVVNLGTCGALAPEVAVGDWMSPRWVSDQRGERVEIDDRLPFAWPSEFNRATGGSLLSVPEPQLDAAPPGWSAFDCVDMEAFEQARALAGSGIAFHALKGVSDRPGRDAEKQFRAEVGKRRAELEKILGFMGGPGEADIAAIIPVHDRRDQIVPCVESVLAQTVAAREVIVVDDGSTDGTADALARSEYADRVRLIRLPENVGVSAARNRGVAEAGAAWIAFLDSDDRWKPDKLARQWQFLRDRPHYRALQSEESWIRRGKRVNRRKYHDKPAGWIWKPSLERCLVTASALLVGRHLLEELGGFDEDFRVCEDYDLWIRMARWHPVGLDPSDTVVKYGGHPDQLSRRYPAMDRFRVLALLAALDAEREEDRAAALAGAARSKLEVLVAGSRHRDNDERTSMLECILASLSAGDYGRPHAQSRKEIRDGFPTQRA